MSKSLQAMIDIETFDTNKTAVTFQVAIVMFDENHQQQMYKTWNLDVDEQLKLGRTMSASTIAFHLGIPGNALESLNGITIPLSVFKSQLTDVMELYQPERIWAKGRFDFCILENMMGENPPWAFWQERELRTLMSECKVDKGEVSHTAVEDCFAQIEQLKQCRTIIGGS